MAQGPNMQQRPQNHNSRCACGVVNGLAGRFIGSLVSLQLRVLWNEPQQTHTYLPNRCGVNLRSTKGDKGGPRTFEYSNTIQVEDLGVCGLPGAVTSLTDVELKVEATVQQACTRTLVPETDVQFLVVYPGSGSSPPFVRCSGRSGPSPTPCSGRSSCNATYSVHIKKGCRLRYLFINFKISASANDALEEVLVQESFIDTI